MEPARPDLPADVEHVLGPRDLVTVEGADAERYLHSQLSQSVTGMAVGEQRWTFVLEPTGKIDSLARITRTGEERFALDIDAGHGEELLARLNRFRIRVDATLELRPSDGVDERPPDLEAERIRLGWPRLGAEIVPGETIPAGTGLTRLAVDFRKGCYPGQELVERMDSRAAEAPRSLRRLTVADGAVAGEPVLDDGVEVGVLTSVHGTSALGWVKRSSALGEVVQF